MNPIYLGLILVLGAACIGMIVYLALKKPLDVKDSTAGHGQHGRRRYMSEAEKHETYEFVAAGQETVPGFVFGYQAGKWLLDTGEHNVMLLAPPGAGKTTRIIIPTIRYNAAVNENTDGQGASMVVLDCKGELYRKCAAALQAAGYKTPCLDLRNLQQSSRYNMLNEVNKAIDEYKAATDKMGKAMAYGKAERFAKIVAGQIMKSSGGNATSESSDYFNETAQGLVVGTILLVSEYAPRPARHIVSVFALILELNGAAQGAQQAPFGAAQPNLMDTLLEQLNNVRIHYYTAPATSADTRTRMNVFSSALSKLVKFIDAELEQVLCGHDEALDAEPFIANPTALFLISPDENPTRHFMSSLLVRSLMNNIIALAENESNEGVLKRKILLLMDEFGQQPPIQDFDALAAAVRSRGGRILLSLQDFEQLQKHYSKTIAQILRGTAQTLITSFVSPSALDTAQTISKVLGDETIMTGSTSSQNGKTSTSRALIGRPLMTPSDLIAMPPGEFIIIKGGKNPLRNHPPGYWEYLTDAPVPQRPTMEYQPVVVADAETLMQRNGTLSYDLTPGMFD